ncbi:hypothetical protein PG291_02130 [Riemerella anatipestifer]|nr:hypothetical protein [Riemerella anatipestifer]
MKKKNFVGVGVFLCTELLFSQAGKVGINVETPTEALHVEGTFRVTDLPLNGTGSAINTKIDGTTSISKDQTFTAIKTVVVDANGVLGTMSGLPVIELPLEPNVYRPIKYCAKNVIGGEYPEPIYTMSFVDSGYIFEWKDTGVGKFTLYVRRTPKYASQTIGARSGWSYPLLATYGATRGYFTVTDKNERVLDASYIANTIGKASLILETAQTFNIDFTTLNASGGMSKVMNICIEQTVQ